MNTVERIGIAARLTWVFVCMASIAFFTVTYNPTFNRDNDIVLAYVLFVLGFPACVVAGWAISGIGYTADRLFGVVLLPNGRMGMVITSALLVLAGYAQWFILLPRVLRWVRARLHRAIPES
jgi:hypothetical protein